MGEPDFAERRPGTFHCLANDECPWVSPNPDINSPEWERARKVREALMISIDRQEIVDNPAERGGVAPVFVALGKPAKGAGPDLRQWEFNPERARQLLKEAGYEDGFEIEVTAAFAGVAAEAESL